MNPRRRGVARLSLMDPHRGRGGAATRSPRNIHAAVAGVRRDPFFYVSARRKVVRVRTSPKRVGKDCPHAQVLALVARGTKNRATRATAANEHSSRSHAVLQLVLEVESVEASTENPRSPERWSQFASSDLPPQTAQTPGTAAEWRRCCPLVLACHDIRKILPIDPDVISSRGRQSCPLVLFLPCPSRGRHPRILPIGPVFAISREETPALPTPKEKRCERGRRLFETRPR